jgi:predicted RNA binding protein YcfA (HicA-like mRNA interferase family)
MTKIPPMHGSAFVKRLQRHGFIVQRQKGSHVILKHADGRVIVVPCHKGYDLDENLMREIKLSPQKFFLSK